MQDQHAIDQLVALGINERQARLYLALLRRAEATPRELHHLSGVPRTKVYEYLEGMVTGGLCTVRTEGRQRYYRAASPASVRTMLDARWERERHEQRRATAAVFTALEELHASAQRQDPGLENIEVIRSREQINHTFLDLMQRTETEVLSFTRSPYAASTEAIREHVKQVQHGAFARGVTIRTIYMVETRDWEWLEGFIAELRRAGERVRFTDALPVKMFIFDRRRVLLTLQSVPGLTGADFSMLSIADAGLVGACADLFELHWDRAVEPEDWPGLKRRAQTDGAPVT